MFITICVIAYNEEQTLPAILKDIAAILGHSSVEITNEYYLSAVDEAVVQTIDNMNKLISSDTISNAIKFEYNSMCQT